VQTGRKGLVQAGTTSVFAKHLLRVALHRCGLLAFAFLGGLFVELTAADFRQDAGLFAGAFEATQGNFEGLVFASLFLYRDISKGA